jgi:hypothetical protein
MGVSSVIVVAGTVVLAASVVIVVAGTVMLCCFPRSWARRGVVPGEAGGGLGEPGTGAVVFLGAGAVPGSLSAFPDWSSLVSVYSWSRAVVFPTSPSCSLRG